VVFGTVSRCFTGEERRLSVGVLLYFAAVWTGDPWVLAGEFRVQDSQRPPHSLNCGRRRRESDFEVGRRASSQAQHRDNCGRVAPVRRRTVDRGRAMLARRMSRPTRRPWPRRNPWPVRLDVPNFVEFTLGTAT
jgi:hypothetical protein